MCGLSGFLQPHGGRESDLRAQARRMADTLVHRGPDDRGEWVDAEAGMALGFRRLAIVDLSPAGHQPMVSADGRFVIAFNGEIYNYGDLRAEMESTGTRFRGASDTEVLVELIARRGVRDSLPSVWGMFAMAVWDVTERVLWLVRDRLGKKPMYYGQSARGTWLFGSELKSLRAHPECPTSVDRGAVVSLLRYSCIPAPASIYTNLGKLPPGCVARIAVGRPAVVEPYWRARDIVESSVARRHPISDEEAIECCDALLTDAVRRRMVADVPVGAFLSGGIDSSLVVATMQALSTRKVRTFSIGFTDPEYNEANVAAAVAAHLGTDHCEMYVTPAEALAVVPSMGRLYDEPFADSSQIPTLIVSTLAKRHVTVALTGDGGDEMFGGYPRHWSAEEVWRRIGPMPHAARALAAGALDLVSPSVWNAVYAAWQQRVPAHARQIRPGDKLRKLTAFLRARDVDYLYEILIAQWDSPEAVVRNGHDLTSWARQEAAGLAVPSVTERVIFRDLVGYLSDDVLVKVDRASMGVSLELRAPLLDHRFVAFSWQLPQTLRIRDGRGKWLLRRVLDRYVPPSLVDRPKTGFSLPIGAWLRGPLRDWAESLLSSSSLSDSDVFDARAVRVTWDRHQRGTVDEALRLWPILMYQSWWSEWQRPGA